MLKPIIQLMRPADWTKNLFVFPALVFSLPRKLADAPDRAAELVNLIVPSLGAFIAFCLLSSGFYALNDVVDLARDRQHPVKRTRPVASGAIEPTTALILSAGLIVCSLILGWLVTPYLVLILFAYIALQGIYNAGLRTIVLVDVTIIAIGFALRAAAGAVAIEVKVSIWLILCVFFLCLYLAFVKRLCDLTSAERAGATEWKSPAGYDNRQELYWLLGVSAVLATLTYLMYTLSDQTRVLFGDKAIGFALLTPLVVIAIHRFFRRALLGLSDSPFAALIRDRMILAIVLLFAIGIVVTIYVPQVEDVLAAVFFTATDEANAR